MSRCGKIIRDVVSAGKHVVILDNGDPSIFGPQIGYMAEFSDLNPVIIPGISSFNAANAALKTSVVNGSARAVMLTSGSLNNGRDEFLAKAIADGVTLALFMVRDLDDFIRTIGAQVSRDMPVAIVSNAGSSSKEMVVTATLGTLGKRIKDVELGPYLLYIGESINQ
jgi:precorrin-4/cobalt-precorrin-4 C11-methyltransferase